MTGRFTCPEEKLAGEIEFAIAYVVACDRYRAREFLLTPPGGSRTYFAGQIAAMLTERAGGGLSGMALEDPGNTEVPAQATRA